MNIQVTGLRINSCLMILLLVILTFSIAKGKDSTNSEPSSNVIPRSWFQLGVGARPSYIFMGGNFFFRVADRIAIGIRSTNASEIKDPFTFPWESFLDVTPAIGYTPLVGSSGMVSTFVGIGLVSGVRRGQYLRQVGFVIEQYEEIRFRRFCIAFELLGVVFIPGTRALGLAASIFTNVNSERPFIGYYIGIQFRQKR